ncbi:DUF6415 family natural product biosynthesis protein [Streptomyces coffeae]|uniref:Uncharacterized protein n=1 Tax=Streptomyces coffeae TaxID=621382 RepID=A0ABS1NP98_9ACTN|nr:DUF6415 family natural product biosynthesis protein [Streptomyces coffeae]MBL1101911.1 hypothetical protein [Streptomyces coffeae]
MAKPAERSEHCPDHYPRATGPESLPHSVLPIDRLGGLPRRQRRHLNVELARPAPVATVHTFIASLHNSFIYDEGIDDDLDTAFGLQSALLAMEDVQGLVPRIRRHLGQLLNIAVQRAAGAPSAELTVIVNRAQQLEVEAPPADLASARGYVRRLALVAENVLEVLTAETTDTVGSTHVEGRWSA